MVDTSHTSLPAGFLDERVTFPNVPSVRFPLQVVFQSKTLEIQV